MTYAQNEAVKNDFWFFYAISFVASKFQTVVMIIPDNIRFDCVMGYKR